MMKISDVVKFLKTVNSAHAWKMAQDAHRILAYPIKEPSDDTPQKSYPIMGAKDFNAQKLQNTWVRLRFYFGGGKTSQEEFWNGK